MFAFVKYRIHDRSSSEQTCGLSCDEDGIFIARNVPLVAKVRSPDGHFDYQTRPLNEIKHILFAAYGRDIDLTRKLDHLNLITRYMNEGRWVLAKISTVHLGLPDLQHEATIQRVLVAGRVFKKRVHREAAKHGSRCPECSRNPRFTATLKRDVSDESRVPAGQPGGGEWTSGESGGVSTKPLSNPLLIPAQAIAPPIVAPFELPLPPTEITPFPITTPNIEPLNPTANPYPDRPECVKEWADAIKFCLEKERKGEFKPGYSGFGKNFQKCVLGMVSEGCGGNPTA